MLFFPGCFKAVRASFDIVQQPLPESFLVSDFSPLNKVSDEVNLKNLQSDDGSFYHLQLANSQGDFLLYAVIKQELTQYSREDFYYDDTEKLIEFHLVSPDF